MGENYILDSSIGRKVHNKRKELELRLNNSGMQKLRRSLMTSFASIGLGREVVMFASKAK
jgi:hypothetical protein